MALAVPALSSSPIEATACPHLEGRSLLLLGALLIDNRLVEDVQIKLRPEHFHEALHGRIYTAILRTVDRNLVANPVTLKPLFTADEAMAELGGPAYLGQLAANTAALFGARDFATQIYDLAILRELIRVGRTMVEQATDTSQEIDPQGQIQEAEIALYRVAEQGEVSSGVKDFARAAQLAVEMARRPSPAALSGVTTGLTSLNEKMGGLHRVRPHHPRRPPAWVKRAGHQHRVRGGAQAKKDRDAGIPLEQSDRRGGGLFSLKCRPTAATVCWPRKRHLRRTAAHGQDQP